MTDVDHVIAEGIVETGTIRQLVHFGAATTSPVFSPDGRWAAPVVVAGRLFPIRWTYCKAGVTIM